jgi:hypothetical protein
MSVEGFAAFVAKECLPTSRKGHPPLLFETFTSKAAGPARKY